MSIEIRELASFDAIRFTGPGVLTILQGDSEKLTINCAEHLLARIASDVADNTLTLGYRSRKIVDLLDHRAKISYQLEVKDLNALICSGSANVVLPDLDTDHLLLRSQGSGDVTLHRLTADRLEVALSGSGRVEIAGDVEGQIVNLSGSGTYHGFALVSDKTDIKLQGSGAASVMVHDELDVFITGSGIVNYEGYPTVNKQINGSGKIIRQRRTHKTDNKGTHHA